jgi:hypothetical protein
MYFNSRRFINITRHHSGPVRDSLESNGFCIDENAMIRQSSPSYINTSLFFEYIINILIQYVAIVRSDAILVNEYVVLLMDSIGVHVFERFLKLHGKIESWSSSSWFTTNLFQALVFVFFGSMKLT